MTPVTKRSASKRFYQLSFEGFRPSGRTKIEQFLNVWAQFIKALVNYIFRRFLNLISIFFKFFNFLLGLPRNFKQFVIRKLIWSRGKLGKTVVSWVVMGVSFMIFLFGEVLSGSSLVINQSVSASYLENKTDIIPKKEIAVTTILDTRQRDESFTYNVETGDTLFSIGNKFKVPTDAIKYVNGLTDSSILKVDQEIIIPPASGLIHTVKSGDTLNSIANRYDVPSQAIADFNYLLDISKLAVGTELVIPGGKIPEVILTPVVTTAGVPSTGAVGQVSPNTSLCVWPTTVRLVTQYFSWYHNGVDIATPWGKAMPPLLACTGGTVTRAGWDPTGLGLHVIIDHGSGYETVYGHMERIDVSYGQSVSRGEIIGLMGNTGRSTGPHVHFMVRYNGAPQNPLSFTQ